MIETKQFTLIENGKTYNYILTMFPGEKGLDIGVRLSKIVIPVLLALLPSITDSGKVNLKEIQDNINIDLVGESVGALLKNVDSKEVVILIKDLLSSVIVKEKDSEQALINVFDRHFTGRFMSIFKIAKEVIQLNNFFGDLAGILNQKS